MRALGPVLDRLAVAQHPVAPGLDLLEQAQHLGPLPFEMLHQHRRIALEVPAFLVVVGMEHGDEVIELAPAQRVVDKVGAGAGPKDDVLLPQILRHILTLEHGAIGDVTGHARRSIANDGLTHFRPQAVAADDGAPFDLFARVQNDRDVRAIVANRIDGAVILQ
jgi:hypothetical protein